MMNINMIQNMFFIAARLKTTICNQTYYTALTAVLCV